MPEQKSLSVILLAGGKGSRIDLAHPKQFTSLNGKPLACYSFDVLLQLPCVEFVVVCPEAYRTLFTTPHKTISFALPGKERMFSVAQGLSALKHPVDFILTHDAARPFLSKVDLLQLLTEGFSIGAATLASPVSSTIKRSDPELFVTETLPREALWEIQTPQLIKHSILQQGLKKLIEEDRYVTDEMGVAESLQHPVKLVKGNALNFKVTTMKDLLFAQLLATQEGSSL